MTLDEALQLGIQRHRAGQLDEAEQIYRNILAVHPGHADSMHLLGAAALQRGSLHEARESISRAIAVNPNAADYHVTLGVVLDTLKQLDEALAEFRRAAELGPDRAEVLTNFGNALRKSGQMKESIDVCRRAVSLRANYSPACVNLGLALRELSLKQPELLDEAIQWLRKATILSPNDPQAHMHLAIALTQKRQLDSAMDSARRALAIQPDGAEAHNVMGSILRESGRLEEATVESRRAIALRPDFHEAHLYLAMALRDLGRLDEAIAAFQSAIQLKPQNAEAHNALAFALCSQNRYVESEAAARAALSIRLNYDEAHNNLGLALQGQSRWEEAIAAHRVALNARPDFPEAHNNISIAYAAIGDEKAAIECVETALKFRPDYPSAHWNRGLRLLTSGDYERGWPEYEWRRRIAEFKLLTEFPRPMWDGSELSGKRILIHNEQGFGDAIQFFRYLPLVARRGGRVLVWCQDSLVRLCQRVEGVDECVARLMPEMKYDVHCPLMSLAKMFKTTVQTIPKTVPYLSLDAKWKDHWRSRIPTDSRKKIGFIWANKPNPANRCPAASAWSPIGTVKDIWFCSLQKRDTSDEARTPPPGVEAADWTDELHDFADTAALIANLDLLITVDTAVAHLAGALGKPVWMLLKFRPDWRWLLDRSDSPWYPTMRLFRQPNRGDWDTPIGQIADALASMEF